MSHLVEALFELGQALLAGLLTTPVGIPLALVMLICLYLADR